MIDPIHDLLVVEPIDSKKTEFATPYEAMITKHAIVIRIGHTTCMHPSGNITIKKDLTLGSEVIYRAVVESRPNNPPIRFEEDGKTYLLLSYFDIVGIEK